MKTPSVKNIFQSYLARIPVEVHLEHVQPGQEISAGGASWQAEKPGDVIVGKSGPTELQVFTSPVRTLEDFANVAQTPQDVLRFTRRYGALRAYEHAALEEDGDEVYPEFVIPYDEWLNSQKDFRQHWEAAQKKEEGLEDWLSKKFRSDRFDRLVLKAAVVRKRGRLNLELLPRDLSQALCLMLLNHYDRLRKCKNETCPRQPYFVARRRDQKYCDEKCARLVANRQWWRRNHSSKKGGSNGS